MNRILFMIGNMFFVPVVLWAQTQQIANNGFNTWSSDGYKPTGWTTVSSALPAALDTTQYAAYTTILQSSFAPTATRDQNDKVEGTASVKLTTIATPSIAQSILGATTPGVIGLGDLDIAAIDAGSQVLLTGSAFAYKPDTILLQYKYEPAGTDTATLLLYFKNGGNDVAGGVITKYLSGTNGVWVTDTIIITTWTDSPDSAVFQISSGWYQGSVLHIDALHFGYVTPPVIPTISLSVSADSINAGETGYLIGTLNRQDTIAFIVEVYGGGTANYQTDFLPSKNYFSFAAGQTADTITITTTAVAAGKYITAVLGSTTNNVYVFASTTPDTLFIKSLPSGIRETNVRNEIKMYPIPVSASLTVIIPTELPAQNIRVTDINGKVVAAKNNISGTTSVNLVDLANGSYMVTFTNAATDAYTATKKLWVVK